MEVTLVNLNKEEKDKFLTFLTDKKSFYEKKAIVMEKEVKMLHACRTAAPMKDNKSWVHEIDKRIKEYSDRLLNIGATVQEFFSFTSGIVNGEEMPVSISLGSALADLYTRERANSKIQLEPKYKYYPRLKKAKEAAIYVFSNKIKIIMEASNVKLT